MVSMCVHVCGCTAAAWHGLVCAPRKGCKTGGTPSFLAWCLAGCGSHACVVHMGLHPAWCSISWNLAVHGALAAAMLLRVLCMWYGRVLLVHHRLLWSIAGLSAACCLTGGSPASCARMSAAGGAGCGSQQQDAAKLQTSNRAPEGWCPVGSHPFQNLGMHSGGVPHPILVSGWGTWLPCGGHPTTIWLRGDTQQSGLSCTWKNPLFDHCIWGGW